MPTPASSWLNMIAFTLWQDLRADVSEASVKVGLSRRRSVQRQDQDLVWRGCRATHLPTKTELGTSTLIFPIPLPPLRERREDIPALVTHFVEILGSRMGKHIEHISPETMSALAAYQWPGNIRELQNFIERSASLSAGSALCPPLTELKRGPEVESMEAITLEDAERDHIRKILEQTRWVVAGPNGAAARLGMKRSTLYFRMQKLGISRADKDPAQA
jgi:transcriptional regulator with AAA-type ATPase domain